ncbi:ABC transporter ATP-binding protein [Candidatus Deianiraea vastatrix]|uniref:ABC-type transporter ATP-binding protein n=1 Tax=Candidatus Deianiraea vastatrix TaxID=2163644 RepID=A0A5B8XDQ2_9RICK|nr:ABC transporter ATP-binding protein [Candidatus Deianiraea vastatrix]QED23448.1 Putative ABC-type transporter ATP-binding protein [Candidatus Deianiraea vastatrix]
MTNILSIRDLSKSFYNGEKVVLDKNSLEIKNGQIFGLVGLNGIGKTTMIKMIIGLLDIDEGEIFVDGIDCDDFAVKQKFCYLPEKFQPSQHLTGIEFLDVFCSFFGKRVSIDEASQMCNAIELDKEVLYMPTSQCSKGMGQKLGLISAFLSNAPLLILDEPMSGLDPKARIAVKEIMKNYVKNGDKSIFFSSHILADIDEICHEIAILNDTKIIFNGTCDNFKKQQGNENLERAFLSAITKTTAK